MSKYPLAKIAGVTKRAIQKALGKDETEDALFEFLHGDLNLIYNSLPVSTRHQVWETTGKRYVHLEETRFVTRHFLRNALAQPNKKALVLSGTDPALACLPWAMSGLANSFTAYEIDNEIHKTAEKRLGTELRKIRRRVPKKRSVDLELVKGDILEADNEYGIIDLDFCSNKLRTDSSRSEVLGLVDRVSPLNGPFVLRTTLHVGRVNNSLKDIEQHIDKFEKELTNPEENYEQYKIRAQDRSPYQSSLPMVSLVWVLERRDSWQRQTEL